MKSLALQLARQKSVSYLRCDTGTVLSQPRGSTAHLNDYEVVYARDYLIPFSLLAVAISASPLREKVYTTRK